MPPRSSLRAREATPAKSTRAASIVRQETPATRRSTRAASRQPISTKDVVSNPGLPEIQTQQSYAYGSSKTPMLPDQLHARSLNLSAVAAHLDKATDDAERNLQAHRAEVRDSTPDSQSAARDERAQRRASKQPVPRSSQSPSVETPAQARKQNRVAAWVQSSSQLDDISEEDSRLRSSPGQSPDRHREESLPSSFPDGSFDHSYSYERGLRGPRLPQSKSSETLQLTSNKEQIHRPNTSRFDTPKVDIPKIRTSRFAPILSTANTKLNRAAITAWTAIKHILNSIRAYLLRILAMCQRSILELPDMPAVAATFKGLIMVLLLSIVGFLFCYAFSSHCDPMSDSKVSQTLQSFCGSCSAPTTFDFNATNSADAAHLALAHKQTQQRIAKIESRLNSHITVDYASLTLEAAALRAQQEYIEATIRKLTKSQLVSDSSSLSPKDVENRLMHQVNFFSPANGALVIPRLTSPTLAQRSFFPVAVARRLLQIKTPYPLPPIAALDTWLGEGDCWCAAPVLTHQNGKGVDQDQDSIRLAIQVPQHVYPTELVVEHFPASGSLSPGTAPKEIELWADFSDVSHSDWQKLHIQDLVTQSPKQSFLPTASRGEKIWARIGTATYKIFTSDDAADLNTESEAVEINANEAYGGRRQMTTKTFGSASSHHKIRGNEQNEPEQHHIQIFNLDINQHGMLHFANRFMLRVRSNHGAPSTCLYRVRLHGKLLQDVLDGQEAGEFEDEEGVR